MDRMKVIDDLIANACCWEEEDRKILNQFSDEKLAILQRHAEVDAQYEAVVNTVAGIVGETVTLNAMPAALAKAMEKKMSSEEEEEEPEPEEDEEDMAENRKPTRDELIAMLNPEDREALAYAHNAQRQEKARIVGQLTANAASDEARTEAAKVYNAMTLDQLRPLAAAMPPKVEQTEPIANYLGMARVPDASGKKLTGEPLLVPTINWGELSKEHAN